MSNDLKNKNIDFAAERVADTIFYHVSDSANKERLKTALKLFAHMILLYSNPTAEDNQLKKEE